MTNEPRVDETLVSKLADCPFCGAAMFEIQQGVWACQFCTESPGETELKGYRITTFSPVSKDGVFYHNSPREYIVRAVNVGKAREKIELRKGYEYMGFEIGDEFIRFVECLGQAVQVTSWQYIKVPQ